MEVLYIGDNRKEYYSRETVHEFIDWLYEEPQFTKWAEAKIGTEELFQKFLEGRVDYE
mgnify:CR=1 FL=1